MIMKTLSFAAAVAFLPSAAFGADLTGEWKISSSIGETPITVYCTLVQTGNELSGSCTPEMANAEPADLVGSVDETSAEWSYDVVFNGNPGHVAFSAETVSDEQMSGDLSLSGTPTKFTATKQ
jgi:hypothetical protein